MFKAGAVHSRAYSGRRQRACALLLDQLVSAQWGFLSGISVKRQGVVSNALHATARIGGILTVKAPNGHFTYPSGDDRPLVLLAGAWDHTARQHVALRRPASRHVPSHDLRAHSPQSRLLRRTRGTGAPSSAGACRFRGNAMARRVQFYPGRVDGLFLQTMVPSIRHAITLMCGPAAMLESLRAELDKNRDQSPL